MIKIYNTLPDIITLTWLLIVFDVDFYQPTFFLLDHQTSLNSILHSPMELVPILFIAFPA